MSAKFTRSLFSLLPKGLFSFYQSTRMRRFLEAVATEFQRAEDYLTGVYDGLFPSDADHRPLRKWAILTGQEIPTTALGRINILRQLRKAGGATVMSFVKHLESLGLPAEVERISRRLERATCNSNCNAYVWSEGVTNAFGIRLPVDRQVANCNSRCDAPLVQNQKDEVLDYLRASAPAHAIVFFFYDLE